MTEDFRTAYESVLNSSAFHRAPQRRALLSYLWERWNGVGAPELWENALKAHSRMEDKDHIDREDEKVATSVRQSCRDVRRELKIHFASAKRGWIIDLPEAIPGEGYCLEFSWLDDPESPTGAFWRAHLYPSHPLYVVYTEQLFYQYWPERFAFRYFDLNAESERQAVQELKVQHPEMHREGLKVGYPYVSYGEIGGRDLLTEWFAKHAMVKIQSAVTRRDTEAKVPESSLILFRSTATNRIMREVLQQRAAARQLTFSIQEGGATIENFRYGRIVIQNPTDKEMKQLAEFKPIKEGSECHVNFSPQEGTDLAILSRIRSPHADTAITLLMTESGRAVYQLARMLVDDARMKTLFAQLGWQGNTVPSSFEILFSIPVSDVALDHRISLLQPLIWRSRR